MDADDLLGQFTIPTPCPMDWDRMPGDDRRRYCAACGKHVYNLIGHEAGGEGLLDREGPVRG